MYLCSRFFNRVLGNLLKNKNMKENKTQVSILFMLFSMLFTICLITSNLLGTKQIALGNISVTGGLIIFPISYIINDCVSEVWGYSKARLLIWVGFLMNFFFVTVCSICDMIPGAPYWDNEAGFHAIFGLAPRIAFASFIAFLAGSFINAYVMSRMKVRSKGKRFSLRAIASTVFGESADSLFFFPLAFYGVIPDRELPILMFWQVVLKTAYEIIVLPLTIQIVKKVKEHEGVDVYDENISYNIFKLKMSQN